MTEIVIALYYNCKNKIVKNTIIRTIHNNILLCTSFSLVAIDVSIIDVGYCVTFLHVSHNITFSCEAVLLAKCISYLLPYLQTVKFVQSTTGRVGLCASTTVIYVHYSCVYTLCQYLKIGLLYRKIKLYHYRNL